MKMVRRWLCPLLCLPLLWACVTRPVAPSAETPSLGVKTKYPLNDEKEIDLLFVIDNSESMKEEQDNLARQFEALIDALRTPKLGGEGCSAENLSRCNIPNIRIGVISSDLGTGPYTQISSCQVPGGDEGKLQTAQQLGGCPIPQAPWIEYSEGQTNLTTSSGDPIQDVKDAFKCIALLGTRGCGFEQPLEAARRALDPVQKLNPGFLRPEAYLAVIFITDEDDCSARETSLFNPQETSTLGPLGSFRCFEHGINCDIDGRQPGPRQRCAPGGDTLFQVEDYANYFANLKPQGRLILFAIAGPTDPLKEVPLQQQPSAEVGLKGGQTPDLMPSCERAGMGKGVPAIRLQALMEHSLLAARGHLGYFNGITQQQRVAGAKETVSICSPDFAPALTQLGELIITLVDGQCLTAPPLTAAGKAACQAGDELGGGQLCAQSCLEQADCVVDEIKSYATSEQERVPLDKCPAALFSPEVAVDACGEHCPCWRLVRQESCARGGGTPYGLEIMRVGDPLHGSWVASECAASPYPWGSARYLALGQCQ